MNDSPSKPSSGGSSLFVVCVAILLGACFGVPLLYNKDGTGLFALVGVPLLILIVARILKSRRPDTVDPAVKQDRRAGRIGLAFVAFFIASIGGIVLGFIGESSNTAPMDVGKSLWACSMIGFIAGVIVAIVVGVSTFLE